MIAIVNRTNPEKYGNGFQHYEVMINRKSIVHFTHKFEDGLAECLRLASESVKEAVNK